MLIGLLANSFATIVLDLRDFDRVRGVDFLSPTVDSLRADFGQTAISVKANIFTSPQELIIASIARRATQHSGHSRPVQAEQTGAD